MISLNWSSSYKRIFNKITKKDPHLKDRILFAMNLLQQEPFQPKLKTHKLKGILDGSWACSVDLCLPASGGIYELYLIL